MGNPRIVCTPSGHAAVTLDFPEELSNLTGMFRNAARVVNESQGGVLMVHFEHFEDDFTATLEKMAYDEEFYDQVVGFWSFAARGGVFSFARDSARAALSSVRVASAGGDTLLKVASSAAFTVGERIVIESVNDGWQQEAALITAKDVSSAPSLTVTGANQDGLAMIFGWEVGARVRSEWYSPQCMVADDVWPITEPGGGLQMTLALRIKTIAGRAVVAEP